MVHENNSVTNCNWCAWYSHQRFGTGTGGLRNKRTIGNLLKYSIVEISQNTEKSPENLRRLAVTQTPVKSHQLMLVGKTPKRENNNNNNFEWIAKTWRKFRDKHTSGFTLRNAYKDSNLEKITGHEGTHEFWFKKFTSIHNRSSQQL